MNGTSAYVNLFFGVILTSTGWVADMLPSLKAFSILAGIIVMVISGWQVYQKGRLQRCQRREIENKNKEEKE